MQRLFPFLNSHLIVCLFVSVLYLLEPWSQNLFVVELVFHAAFKLKPKSHGLRFSKAPKAFWLKHVFKTQKSLTYKKVSC